MLRIRGTASNADTGCMGTPGMTADSNELIERLGRRSMRLLVLASGMFFMVLVAGWTVVRVMILWRSDLGVRATLLGLALLLVFGVWLRVMSLNWQALGDAETHAIEEPPVTPADPDEGTGIWGVGGPAMREPGSTGTWPRRVIDRRYDNSDD
jgi:hypothetical protein